MSRGARMLVGSAVKAANLLLNVFVSFYMMPFLVKSLGDRMYGLWTLVGSVIGYYGLMDLGLSSAVVRFISRAVGQGDREEVKKVVNTAFFLFAGLGAAAALVTRASAAGLVYMVKDPEDLRLFQFLLLLTGLSFASDFPVRPFNAVLTSHLREDLGTGISVVKTLLNTAGIFLVIRAGRGVVGICVVTVALSALDSAVRVLLAFRLEPGLSIGRRYFDRARLRPLFSYSAVTLIGRLGDVMRFRLDQLIITAYAGLQAVTHYFVGARLIESLAQFLLQIVGVVTPYFSQEEGRRDYAAIRRNFLFLTKISLYASFYFAGALLLCGRPFIRRWMGDGYDDAFWVLAAFLPGVFVKLVQMPTGPLLFGVSKHHFLTVSNLIEGVVNLLLSLWLVKRWGIVGVALGTTIPMAVMGLVVQPWYVGRVLEMPVGIYLRLLAGHGALAALFFGGAALLSKGWLLPSYPHLFLASAVQGAVFIPLAFRLGFAPEERALLLNTVLKALGKRGKGA